jgi:uncharacterized membrane protein
MQKLKRILRHVFFPPWRRGQLFPEQELARLGTCVGTAEQRHRGELRLAIETNLPLPALWTGVTARQRAIEVFSSLRVWDTELNSGVLVYLLLADHKLEIVADRGIDARMGAEAWQNIVHDMEAAFNAGRYVEGLELGLRRIGDSLVTHFPAEGVNPNELPDRPVIL